MLNFRKIHIYFLMFIGILFLLISCEEDANNEVNQTKELEILPLKIGNSWTYKLNVYPKDDSLDTYREYTMRVLKNTSFNDKNYFNIEVDGNLEGNLYINKEDGHYFLNSRISQDYDILAYKFPCDVGDSWERLENQFVYGNKSVSTVKSLNSKISVPYGEVECLEYDNEKKSFFSTNDTLYILEKSYLKPGLGVVNISTFHKINFDGEYALYSSIKLVNATVK